MIEHDARAGAMGTRGATRPMHDADDAEGHGEPYSEPRYALLRAHHRQTLWVYWALIILGVWTAVAPFNFGYLNEALWVDPSGGRGAWWSAETHIALRAALMTWSDVISGLLLVVLGWRSLRADRPIARWLACAVGAWMSAAPVLFWAPVAAAYVNDTLVGMLVLALTILIPGMPNMPLYMRMGGAKPPGWSYNPSSWPQRWILIALGLAGLLASRYLAIFQLGYVDAIWDPFFGESTRRVLSSNMSRSLPISDAGLGALAYTFEFLMGFMGSPSRWRTMPWMVALFGVLVIPLGLVHIFLVISQPVVVGEWCTFCLLAAAIMLPMIPLEVDEVIAMAQHVRRSMKRGERFWPVFWKGGDASASEEDERSPEIAELPVAPRRVIAASLWGMSAPWTLVVSAILGAAMMAVPDLLGVVKPASIVLHLGGALVVVVAVIAMGEPLRSGRYLDVPLGLTIAIAPWALAGGSVASRVLALLAGLAIAALALPRGSVRERFGGWDRSVRAPRRERLAPSSSQAPMPGS